MAREGAPGERLVRDLSNYAFSPLRDGDLTLYRGRGKGLPPILLVAAESGSPACLKRLEHEYTLRTDLDAAWAAHPIELSRHRNRMALVLEDPGGAVLDRMLGRPLAITEFLRIGISLAVALRQVHACGMIHKDIKPGNMLVDVASGAVWLTGFGIASRLLREHQHPEAPEVIAGTLAYMAPEQTGRMNRSVDARSDLYSLGITFYEMLTGTLPFRAADALGWVHCHIAKRADPPEEREVSTPGTLSAIVMRLLAKTAEERYQTAAGLQADLRRCLEEWETHGRIDPFPLGAHDTSDRLLIPERLYGREREVETLLACFNRVVAQGIPELVLVSGYSGIGKSSVVNELQKVLIAPHGLYASGKFDQYKRDIPYATMAQAFQSLVRSLLSRSETELARWRDSFSEALGSNGQLIVDLVPELELLVGKQPVVPDLLPQEAKNRFQMVFRRFIGVFARKEHPLALFLDDLQWLDAATLDLLRHLITHSEMLHLLLVGAYRDNEVGPAHPLTLTLEAIRKADARVHEIVLRPLGISDVGRLISDTVHCLPERARPLAQLVQEKTGGNPFFAIQFLTTLVEEELLAYDPARPAWVWDINRIDAKDYTDNVVDLVIRKLKRLTPATQDALSHLACLGNVAEIGMLSIAHQQTEEAMHAALWEAVRAGLLVHQSKHYKFLHDRIQQAAYSLFPEYRRPAVHLRIGRMLRASMTADQIDDFEVANQFNRGTALLVDRAEKADIATLNLRTGRKAKAAAAYASACTYFSAGMALLDDRDWDSQYDLTFALWIERAQCELLSGNFDTVEQLLVVLLQRGVSKLDQAAAFHLKVQMHSVKGEYPQAVDSALTCLRLFDIDLPAHPTWEQVQTEYETVWQTLDGRSIESLIDLPLLTDPGLNAAMQLFLDLTPAAYLTDFHLSCLQMSRVVKLTMQYGASSASAHAFGYWGTVLGPVFHRYSDAQRLAKLGCDLVEKHGFLAHRAHVHYAMGRVAFWTQPIGAAIDFMRANYRALIETGDQTLACHSRLQTVTGLLLRNDPLDAVYRESESALDFALKAKYGDAADIIERQRRFIAVMQGGTTPFSTFNDAQFEQAVFDAKLPGRTPLTISWHWILELKSRFILGDYAEALAAADEVKPLLYAVTTQIQLLDYVYYSALTVAALYEHASADRQAGWHELLTAHHETLREWAENNAPTFSDKHALVSAEIARIEGRESAALRLYEQAIRSSREHGFVQNEGLAHEVAAGFYATRGVESVAHMYVRNARYCYLRWGALGKVRQLERLYPWLTEESAASVLSATIDAPVGQLDVGTVVKASQAVSNEIELSKVIETLMRISLEHAGAERGLLILLTGNEPRIAAEARTGGANIEVTLRDSAVTPAELIESVLNTAARTRESVILDDASAQTPSSADQYVRQKHARSVLCLPLVKQSKLVGALYLENNLTPRVFTSAKLALLKLLASQAAISLENVRLYDELRTENSERQRAEEGLRRSEAYLSEAQKLSHTGVFGWNPSSGEIYWSEEAFRIFEYDPASTPTMEMIRCRIHPNDTAAFQHAVERASADGQDYVHEYRLRMPDERVKHIHVVARSLRNESSDAEFVGAVMDVTAIRLAELELHKARTDLAHVMRVTSLGELTASIAHEVNQPLGAVLFNAEASLSWLERDRPNIAEVRAALERIVRDGTRAGEVIGRIRTLAKNADTKMAPLNLNEALSEALTLVQHELLSSRVALRTEYESALPVILADKVQLQQVILNLVLNSIEAMESIADRPREIVIRSEQDEAQQVRVTVTDCGVGFSAASADRLFNTFFTTKSTGMGMGLSICRSIIKLHGGRIWAEPNLPHGATMRFTLPLNPDTASR
jgi:predicted ATPase/signal transduction histidine kinase